MRFTVPMMDLTIPKKKSKERVLEKRGKIKRHNEFQNSSDTFAAAGHF